MPQMLSCGNGMFGPPSYHGIRRMEMLRLGIGVAIGWFAYDALEKRSNSVPDIVKTCVTKAVEVFKKDENNQLPGKGKEECAK